MSAGIVHADAALAPEARAAVHVLAAIRHASPVLTHLALGAGHVGAGVGHADAVLAPLAAGAGDEGADANAGPVPAELAGLAGHAVAGITDAEALDAPLTRGAARGVAVVGHALALGAHLAAGAVHPVAGIDAGAALADQPVLAGGQLTDLDADPLAAHEALAGALIVEAGIRAAASDAGALGALGPLVDAAVAVLVPAITHLGRQRAALAAGVAQIVIDHAVAVVVLAVAGLHHGIRAGITHQIAAVTDEHAVGAEPRLAGDAALADAGHRLVDLTVAVVVQAVADLVAGRDLRLTDEGPGLTAQPAPGADAGRVALARIADAGDALVYEPVAVLIDAVTLLGARIVEALTDDLAALALGDALGAQPRLAKVAGRAGAGIALVDLAVAVVVEAVALLIAGGDAGADVAHAVVILVGLIGVGVVGAVVAGVAHTVAVAVGLIQVRGVGAVVFFAAISAVAALGAVLIGVHAGPAEGALQDQGREGDAGDALVTALIAPAGSVAPCGPAPVVLLALGEAPGDVVVPAGLLSREAVVGGVALAADVVGVEAVEVGISGLADLQPLRRRPQVVVVAVVAPVGLRGVDVAVVAPVGPEPLHRPLHGVVVEGAVAEAGHPQG